VANRHPRPERPRQSSSSRTLGLDAIRQPENEPPQSGTARSARRRPPSFAATAISFRRRCDSRRSGSGASPRPDVDPGPLSSAHAHRCASTPLAHRAKDRHGAADGGTHGRRRGLAGVLEPREPFPVHCALGARGATSIRTRKLVFDLATQERAVRVVGAGCVEGWKRTRAQSRCGRRHRAARRPRGGCRATHNEERERPKESLAHQWTSYALRGTGARRSSEPTPNRSRSLLARTPLAGRVPAVDAI
jgi:hypothetical protein